MSEIHGDISPRFEPVARAAARNLRSGEELGLSLAVDLDGERVVDLWGGHRDLARTLPWQRDTVTNVWSITKTVTSLAVLLLVDAGELDVHAPVARYWPEFAAAGKEAVQVRHLLSHTSGLSGLEKPVTLDDLYDVRGTAARLAAQPPWWRPGTASGYHVLTYGHLLGELVQRISGVPLREFVDRELVAPSGADFQLGLAPADVARVSDVVPPDTAFDAEVLDHDTVAYKTFTGPVFTAAAANTPAWRAAELGAANGHGNAASVADVLRPLAAGGTGGAGRSLGDATLDTVFERQSDGPDLVNGLHLRWGVGFALPDVRTLPWIPSGRVAFWGGWGGSMAVVDRDRRVVISYVMNRMGADILGSDRAREYVSAVYRALGPAGCALTLGPSRGAGGVRRDQDRCTLHRSVVAAATWNRAAPASRPREYDLDRDPHRRHARLPGPRGRPGDRAGSGPPLRPRGLPDRAGGTGPRPARGTRGRPRRRGERHAHRGRRPHRPRRPGRRRRRGEGPPRSDRGAAVQPQAVAGLDQAGPGDGAARCRRRRRPQCRLRGRWRSSTRSSTGAGALATRS